MTAAILMTALALGQPQTDRQAADAAVQAALARLDSLEKRVTALEQRLSVPAPEPMPAAAPVAVRPPVVQPQTVATPQYVYGDVFPAGAVACVGGQCGPAPPAAGSRRVAGYRHRLAERFGR